MEQKITDRINDIKAHFGISTRELEASIGATNGVLAKALQRDSDISSKWLSKIVLEYKVNAHWLLTGERGMFETQQDDIQNRLTRIEEALHISTHRKAN